jgi:2-oxoisovalerate dehydrogenase E1 component
MPPTLPRSPAPLLPTTLDWPRVARLLLTSRIIDTIEEKELTPAGKVLYQFSAKGHELAQILLGLSLTHPHDAAAVYYRSRPFMLAAGLTAQEAFAGGMAKMGSPSEGRDVGVVYSMPPRRGVTVLPSSGDVGAQYTPAAGWAQAIYYRRHVLDELEWEGAIAVALGGDGSTAANGFWAALNIVTTLNLPMLFFIEDNSYAISVPTERQSASKTIAIKAVAYGFEGVQVDGNDILAVIHAVRKAVDKARAGGGPTLIEAMTYRRGAHSSSDDPNVYRCKTEVEEWEQKDPIMRFQKYLAGKNIWTPEWEAACKEKIHQEIARTLEEVEGIPPPPVASLFDDVYQEMPWHLKEQKDAYLDHTCRT